MKLSILRSSSCYSGRITQKKPEAANLSEKGDVPAAETSSHQKTQRKSPRAPRISEHLPFIEHILDHPEVLAEPEAWRRIGEEVREQLDYQRGYFRRLRLVRGKFRSQRQPAGHAPNRPTPCKPSGSLHRYSGTHC
ncbi:MAG: hypothetical protein HC767_15005 [Akkermansiaceae bacterium]|nr:hypothetical protein [Akkermansiaceae bacterium]